MMAPLLDPQPGPGRLAPRAGPAARLRAVHHRRHRAWRSGSASGAGSPAAAAPATSPRSRPGWCRSASSAAGSTTSSPRRSRTSAPAASRCTRSTSGRAGWASGAPSPSAASAPGSAAGGAASRCRRSPTRWRPGIAARAGHRAARQLLQPGAVRPPHRPAVGAARSTPRTGPSGYADQATYHPTFLYELLWNVGVAALVIWADRRFRLGPRPGLRPVRRGVHRRPVLDRGAAHRPGARHPRPAAERLDQPAGLPRRGRLLRGQRPAAARPRDARGARGPPARPRSGRRAAERADERAGRPR